MHASQDLAVPTTDIVSAQDVVDILLVDDRTENLIALEAALASQEYNIVQCHSGEEALRQLLKQDYAVILMDVQMPGLDGFETAKLIRQRERSRYTPIIFLTAINTSDTNVLTGYLSGAIDYLFKPLDSAVLRSKVNAFVELFRQKEHVRKQAEVLTRVNCDLEQAIAERRKAEALLEKLNSELEERVAERTEQLAHSNEALRQFANIASHDLQEPLRMVQGYSQLLLRRYQDKLDAEAVEFITFINKGVERMQSLIQDVLDHSYISNRNAYFSRVETSEILGQVLCDLRGSINESGADITMDELPVVSADGPQLKQLFQNLVSNALKFRSSEPPSIHIGAKLDGPNIVFSVQDNGIGLEPEYREQIFEMFKRLHNRNRYPGNGIGLAICKQIVEAHNGQIWVESEPGEGSTFYFTIRSDINQTNENDDKGETRKDTQGDTNEGQA
jgi:signal transduction histidine kinase